MPEGVKAGTAYVDVDANLAAMKKTLDKSVPVAINAASKKAGQSLGSKIGGHLREGLTGSLGQISGINLGAGITGIGAGLDALAAPRERARAGLEATFKAAGKNIEDYRGQIDKTIAHNENLGHSEADSRTALSKLTAAYQDPKKALHDMSLVADVAAFKHISLASAAQLVVKAHAGSTRVFKEFGIQVKKNKDGTVDTDKAMRDLAHRVSGQATAAVSTFSGHLDVWKTKIQDVAAQWGEKLGPALTVAGPLLLGVSGIVDTLGGSFAFLISPVGLVILALVALAAGAVYAYTHWQAFHDVVDGIGRWFRDVLWPIIQNVATEIVRVFESMKNDAILIWNGLRDFISGIIMVVRGIIQTVTALIHGDWGKFWDGIKLTALGAWYVLVGIVKIGIGWVMAPLHGMAQLAGDLWGWMYGGLDSIWNSIISTIGNGVNTAIDALNVLIGAANIIPGVNIPEIGHVHWGGGHVDAPVVHPHPGVAGPPNPGLMGPPPVGAPGGPRPLRPGDPGGPAGPPNPATRNVTINNYGNHLTAEQLVAAADREDRLSYAGG